MTMEKNRLANGQTTLRVWPKKATAKNALPQRLGFENDRHKVAVARLRVLRRTHVLF